MKNIYILFAVILMLSLTNKVTSQITVSATDFAGWMAVGTTLNSFSDTTSTQINIGTPGSNSWDFSGLIQNLIFTTTSVTPSSTPYAADYPGAGYAFATRTYMSGVLADSWIYLDVNGNYYLHGVATNATLPQVGSMISKISYSPVALEYQFPAEFGSSWSYSGVQTVASIVAGFPTTLNQNTSATYAVDGYGVMTLPGGRTVEALRIKTDLRMSYTILPTLPPVYSRSISYGFISKFGDYVSVSVADTNASSSGSVPVNAISWNVGSGGTTSVDDSKILVKNYELNQNYPNPFNPSTVLEFSIPDESFVDLKVYNILGSEVAVLINKNLSAGKYSAEFKAVNLPSGIYFAELITDKFQKVIKMNLIK
ncbi:MAG: T9SS type A sorting domain-containing protein [bacterium]